MTEAEFLYTVRLNLANAAILDRLPELEVSQAHLVAGALFQTIWNVRSGQAPDTRIRDYDLFYWDADTSYEAEDTVIRRAAALFADLGARIEVRNQARVHLWFPQKFGLTRPPLHSAREGIDQFLVECTCVGVDERGTVYAPYGLADLAAGRLRPNLQNHTPDLYAAKVADYRQRWPWLREVGDGEGE
ncbi:nucleotidyltransferase family protein [Deinococcus apachensis]|uniref:nucleotidyltransferase family protein n=1 Tax=Deinococcus apachensis TaxID=309886 RepID=UPI00036974D8|nr:nucleotidyltransferase family protein [Deinococcus apachensis]